LILVSGGFMHPLFNGCTLKLMNVRSPSFNPASYADVPLYNIQAVSAATGVPAITLRSWERRYGVPVPRRDAKGYRLYSERDIAVARWLRDRVQQGVGISRAVNMLRVLERGELTTSPVVTGTFDLGQLQTRLVDAVARLDVDTIEAVLAEGLMVVSVEEVALQLLQPALYDVGEHWARGRLSVTSEHVGSNVIRSHIAQLVRISPAPWRPERIFVGCAPGELHDIGALIVALFLRRRGFDVVYLGPSVEPESLRQDVATLPPAAVCLSAGAVETAGALKDLFERLTGSYDGLLGFGGRVFSEDPALVDGVPGVYLGPDAGAAVDQIEGVLGR
jgi:methanogenic corrinoid protein MtbC1